MTRKLKKESQYKRHRWVANCHGILIDDPREHYMKTSEIHLRNCHLKNEKGKCLTNVSHSHWTEMIQLLCGTWNEALAVFTQTKQVQDYKEQYTAVSCVKCGARRIWSYTEEEIQTSIHYFFFRVYLHYRQHWLLLTLQNSFKCHHSNKLCTTTINYSEIAFLGSTV